MNITSIQDIIDAAIKIGPKKVAVVGAQEAEALQAMMEARKLNLAEPVLIGNQAEIDALASDLKLDLTGIERIEETDVKVCAQVAIDMAKAGQVDFFMKGLIATADLLKCVLNKQTGMHAGRLASHVAVLTVDGYHKPFLMSDAGINIRPDLAAKKDILANALIVARALGITLPKVSILTALEKVNPKMQNTVDAAEMKAMNQRGEITDCIIEGPLATDNTFSRKAADIKGIDSPVAGDADIVIVDDLESGNILYKSVVFLGGGTAAGVLMGAAKPVVLTSRADDKLTKMASIALGVLTSNVMDVGKKPDPAATMAC